ALEVEERLAGGGRSDADPLDAARGLRLARALADVEDVAALDVLEEAAGSELDEDLETRRGEQVLAEEPRAPRLEPVRGDDEPVAPARLEGLERGVREEEPEVHLPRREAPPERRRARAEELLTAVLLAEVRRIP